MKTILLLITCLIGLYGASRLHSEPQSYEPLPAIGREVLRTEPQFADTLERLFHYLQFYGCPYPEAIIKVAIHESGHKSDSELAKKYKNPFGMMCVSDVKHRRFTNAGCVNGYSRYDSFEQACQDFSFWAMEYPPNQNENPYAWLQRRGYNPSPTYYNETQDMQWK